MTRFKILSAAAILSLMFATPVFAQAAIQEPGAFAFYYPNNDVLNGGRPTPAARMDAMAGLGPFSGSYAYAATDSAANGDSCAQRYHSYDPSSGTFLGNDGRRHACE
jgi:BA14K-like protein